MHAKYLLRLLNLSSTKIGSIPCKYNFFTVNRNFSKNSTQEYLINIYVMEREHPRWHCNAK